MLSLFKRYPLAKSRSSGIPLGAGFGKRNHHFVTGQRVKTRISSRSCRHKPFLRITINGNAIRKKPDKSDCSFSILQDALFVRASPLTAVARFAIFDGCGDVLLRRLTWEIGCSCLPGLLRGCILTICCTKGSANGYSFSRGERYSVLPVVASILTWQDYLGLVWSVSDCSQVVLT